MKHERKFSEARYFYAQMKLAANDRSVVENNFSAFINAARSVIQYIIEDGKSNTTIKAWYKQEFTGPKYPLIRYFKEKRDLNIHSEPVNLNLSRNVGASSELDLTQKADGGVFRRDENGKLVPKMSAASEAASEAAAKSPASAVIDAYRFFLQDRPADDLFDLAEGYMAELTALMDDGRAAGYIPHATENDSSPQSTSS